MFRRAMRVLIVNVVLFCVLAELAGLVVHYAQTGELFYLHRQAYSLIQETAQGEITADRLNPYFGPSHKAGQPFDFPAELRDESRATSGPLSTNNFGFDSPYQFPIVKGNREFIVGIFGGSVGVFFCLAGVDRLVADLQQHEFFKDRAIVPLCMAHEGYKQPQQLLVLAYFLSIGQTFDLVINIDGFNEVALSPLNNQQGVDISMPSVSHLLPLINLIDQGTLTPEKLESLAAISQYKQRLNWLTEILQRNRLASVGVLLGRYRALVASRYDEESRRFATLHSVRSDRSLVSAIPPTEQRLGAMLYDDIARNWAQSSLLMRDMLAARGTPYVHALQPNQYSTSRSFTPEEARSALNAASPYKPGVEQGYPALLAEAASRGMTRKRGFLDATHIFDKETTTVYIDNCCHYTSTGYRLLADAIASAVMSLDSPWADAR
jgi:hypothetical protein